ncbi:uncharacterized protein PG998_002396 [Apiospora kogelbergensis]|uniref:uncharacterized protein n=1 Tax=Apiospora kogelbergensis TaxID=1337665 RepID=UPI00312DDEEF
MPAIAVTQTSLESESSWKRKGKGIARKPVPKATPTLTDVTEDDAEDGHDAEFDIITNLLRDAHDVETDTIINILGESIDTVKARLLEEAVRKAEAEDALNLRENKEKGKAVETKQTKDTASEVAPQKSGTDYPQTDATPAPEANRRQPGPTSVNFAGTKLTIDEHGLLRPAPIPPKSIRRSVLGLLRRLNNFDKTDPGSAAASHSRKTTAGTTVDLDARLNAILGGKDYSPQPPRGEASVSSTDSGSSTHSEQVECVSCLDDFDLHETVKAPCHSYCHDCFKRLIGSACENEQHWPPKCCLNIIPELFILAHADEDLKKRYRDRVEEWSIPVSERVYCHRPDCSLLLRPAQINRALNVGRCTKKHSTCILCRGEQHKKSDNNGACPQDRDIQRTAELAEEAGWKKCIGCHAWVEHSDACQHMTCRCGAQFCYVCGARWRTCYCTMEQLSQVKTAAQNRQTARTEREAREESEIAEAIRQVAEFEREEARKAELLRLELERQAAERRRQELEMRIASEEARRADIERKFAALRDVLEDLHNLQRAAVGEELDRRAYVLLREARVAKQALVEANGAARKKLYADAVAKLGLHEEAFENELFVRIREERRIEEKYRTELREFYDRRLKQSITAPVALTPNELAEREIEEKMASFLRKHDAKYAEWRMWKGKAWETYNFQVTERRDIRLELLDVAETRMDEAAEQGRKDFQKERSRQLAWVYDVFGERKKMLVELETAEKNNGAEDLAAWLAEQEAIDTANLEDMIRPTSASTKDNKDSSGDSEDSGDIVAASGGTECSARDRASK